jgi:hypothetical protein
MLRTCQDEANRAVCALPVVSGQTGKWILKQVQDDGE